MKLDARNTTACFYAALLLPLYAAGVYVATGFLTGGRAELASIYFSFESRIPLIPISILPYLSLDLLFIIAVFLPKSPQELLRLVFRLVTVVAIAAICFLVFPLHFAFPRSAPDGFFSLPYQALYRIDSTHNMLPSLHAAITLIIWPTLARHTPKPWRPAVHLWLTLTIFSTLFTHQHHIPDVLAALILAGLMFLLPFRHSTSELRT